jgi:hypothetical protein
MCSRKKNQRKIFELFASKCGTNVEKNIAYFREKKLSTIFAKNGGFCQRPSLEIIYFDYLCSDYFYLLKQ